MEMVPEHQAGEEEEPGGRYSRLEPEQGQGCKPEGCRVGRKGQRQEYSAWSGREVNHQEKAPEKYMAECGYHSSHSDTQDQESVRFPPQEMESQQSRTQRSEEELEVVPRQCRDWPEVGRQFGEIQRHQPQRQGQNYPGWKFQGRISSEQDHPDSSGQKGEVKVQAGCNREG
jgi:hypothetical protein